MTAVFRIWGPGEEIPVMPRLANRKMVKYLNRETMAAVVTVGELADRHPLDPDVPFYYATGRLAYQDYGLEGIVAGSRGDDGRFFPERFIGRGIGAVSPLNQFKVLQNMPLSFVAITHGLHGDNAVVYGSAAALLRHARVAPGNGPVLLAAGLVRPDGRVESGAALADRRRIASLPDPPEEAEGVEILRRWDDGWTT